MRLPSITTPEPVASLGACLAQGLKGSGYRNVEKTFTTAFSTLAGAAGAGFCAAVASDVTNRRPISKRDVITREISSSGLAGFWHRLSAAIVAVGGTVDPGKFLFHRLSKERLGIRGTDVLALLAAGDIRFGPGESILQGCRLRQRVPVKGLAEVGELAIIAAAEGGPVGRRGRENDGIVVTKGINERTRVTCGDHDHFPLDPRCTQRVGQVSSGQVTQTDSDVGH